MTLHLKLLLTSSAALLLSAGCTPQYPKCEKDEHCNTDGHKGVCVNNTCQECGKDADCKDGFVCKANKCSPKPECTEDGNCQAGFKCRAERCSPECSADAECTDGQRCQAGRCAAIAACRSDADCGSGQSCDASGRCVEGLAGSSRACDLSTVRFGFNEWTLSAESRRILEENAECLRKSKPQALSLVGHADERGTEEYNLHLGEKRAQAVRKHLAALGVDAPLKTLSYGEEQPAVPGNGEEAWSQNRRVEFEERQK